jgi:hypothetical protein
MGKSLNCGILQDPNPSFNRIHENLGSLGFVLDHMDILKFKSDTLTCQYVTLSSFAHAHAHSILGFCHNRIRISLLRMRTLNPASHTELVMGKSLNCGILQDPNPSFNRIHENLGSLGFVLDHMGFAT